MRYTLNLTKGYTMKEDEYLSLNYKLSPNDKKIHEIITAWCDMGWTLQSCEYKGDKA